MDQRDNQRHNPGRPPAAEQDGLLDDLESIRALLEGGREDSGEQAVVPFPDDLVGGAPPLSARDHLGIGQRLPQGAGPPGSLQRRDDALLDSLLDRAWQSAAGEVLTLARGAIEAHRNEWTPTDTDELNQALRERIDATLNRWLRETVRAHLDELRAELLEIAGATINDQIAHLNDTRPDHQEPRERRSEDHG